MRLPRQDASGNPVGTGAFRFVSNAMMLLSLAAVDDAWQGRPFVDAIEITGRRSVRNAMAGPERGTRGCCRRSGGERCTRRSRSTSTVVQSGDCDLLALSVARNGALADDAQREAIALAVDRAALYNVIFQKQGEMTASLLPDALTGYAFSVSRGARSCAGAGVAWRGQWRAAHADRGGHECCGATGGGAHCVESA